MRHRAWRIVASLVTAAALSSALAAQQLSTAVTPEYRRALAERLADELARGYVMPDVGAAMALRIRTKLRAGAYDSLPTARALAVALARDIDSVAHDRHMGIAPRAPSVAAGGGENRGSEQRLPSPPSAMAEVKVLAGNIGYIRLDEFPLPEDLAPVLDSAMRTVARTDALIVDLRTNRGGSADGMLYLAGYFFERPTLIAHLYSREDESTTEMRSAPVSGPRYLNRPLYVLTSRRTFSAAEAAAYHLKYSAHAITVGDTTGGGAHRIRGVDLNDDFTLLLPYTRVMNALTHGDWEGVGVLPEIPVTSASALDSAWQAALRRLPSTPEREAALKRMIRPPT
jgi:retinol-binding protein 3